MKLHEAIQEAIDRLDAIDLQPIVEGKLNERLRAAASIGFATGLLMGLKHEIPDRD